MEELKKQILEHEAILKKDLPDNLREIMQSKLAKLKVQALLLEKNRKDELEHKPKKKAASKKPVSKKVQKIESIVEDGKKSTKKDPKYARITKGMTEEEIRLDKQRTAKKPGKRISKDGNIYHENRRNRSDVDPRKKI